MNGVDSFKNEVKMKGLSPHRNLVPIGFPIGLNNGFPDINSSITPDVPDHLDIFAGGRGGEGRDSRGL